MFKSAYLMPIFKDNVVIVDEQTITLDVTVPLGTENGAHNLGVYLEGTGQALAAA